MTEAEKVAEVKKIVTLYAEGCITQDELATKLLIIYFSEEQTS